MTEGFFGIHTAADFPRAVIRDFVELSSVVKFCMGNFNDSHFLHEWRTWNPDALFVGRYIALDIEEQDGHGGELHRRYEQLQSEEEAYNLGVWFATQTAKNVLVNNLEWVAWEGGPNEINDVSAKNPAYNLGFGHTMQAYGLKFLLGNQSYGRPKVPELDNGVDEWINWSPVFELIDRANRDGAGRPLAEWRAALQLHAYGNRGSLVTDPQCTITRHELLYNRHILPRNLYVPLILGELGYATDRPGDHVPETWQLTQQLVELNELLLKYWYLAGYCFWDFRAVTENLVGSGWKYCWADFIRTLKEKNYTQRKVVPPGTIVPVPPAPEPEPDPPSPDITPVVITGGDYKNVRQYPSLASDDFIAGRFNAGETGYINPKEAVSLGRQDSWIYVQAPSCEGWCAAWLLKQKG